MAEITINGNLRTEFGKGASRRDRRAGLVPAVIYGHGETPTHVSLPARELIAALKQSNVLLDVVVGGKTELTLPKSVTKNPLTSQLEHIDLVLVRRGERVTVEVPVHTTGEHDRDGILEHVNNVITVEAEATSIPSFLTLDLTGMKAGLSLYAADVPLPAGTTLVSDPHMPVVHLSERATPSDDTAVAATPAETPAAEAPKA
ncbi:MAG: 50S ribosomal protein L25/general stress protein Ctc [Actinomycetes bacterium]|jgi:large subunit ribosomal protein L25